MSFSIEDSNALLSSEIFRIFATNEIDKEKKHLVELDNKKEELINNFEKFQKHINSSEILKKTFKDLQQQFLTNAELVEQTDPSFVEGVLLLDIEE